MKPLHKEILSAISAHTRKPSRKTKARLDDLAEQLKPLLIEVTTELNKTTKFSDLLEIEEIDFLSPIATCGPQGRGMFETRNEVHADGTEGVGGYYALEFVFEKTAQQRALKEIMALKKKDRN